MRSPGWAPTTRSGLAEMSSPLPVSVVVNTYNRAASLRQTLAGLSQLDYPNFELVVVNGPSTDDTEAVLA